MEKIVVTAKILRIKGKCPAGSIGLAVFFDLI
jgi:hypothetical protein